MEKAAWKLTIPIDREGKKLEFECNDIGIDEFMAVQSFLNARKMKEAILLFFNSTRIGGADVAELKAEFDKNNFIPFNACIKLVNEVLEPVPGEIKKN